MEKDVDEVNKIARLVKSKIEELDHENLANWQKPGCGKGNGTSLRIHRVMIFSNGDKCWNGPDRSLKCLQNLPFRDAILGESPFGHPLQQGFVTSLLLQAGMAANLSDFVLTKFEGKEPDGTKKAYVRLTPDYDAVDMASKIGII